MLARPCIPVSNRHCKQQFLTAALVVRTPGTATKNAIQRTAETNTYDKAFGIVEGCVPGAGAIMPVCPIPAQRTNI